MTEEPLFPFGFGLSYTKFIYKDLSLEKTTFCLNEEIQVSVSVGNIGNVAGEEVVQLYIKNLDPIPGLPIIELKGCKRVFLKPDETKKIDFILSPEMLSFSNKVIG